MPTGNPLEQLRRRLQSQATPTAFAAIAEEHRRAGRLAEAVAVCREGLERYPAYVSGRVTLGRALLDSGNAAAAVTELEHAVAQSPDNLAAARALETARAALGDAPWAAAPAPGDVTADRPVHTPGAETMPMLASLVECAPGTGPDDPQDFDLGLDWSLPVTPPPLPAAAAPAPEDDRHTATFHTPSAAAGNDASIDGDSSSLWAGTLSGDAAVETPAPLSGWSGDADAFGQWHTPDGPSATWALGEIEAGGADPTPFQGTLQVEDPRPGPFAGLADTSDWAETAATAGSPLMAFPPEAPQPAAVAALEDAPGPWLEESPVGANGPSWGESSEQSTAPPIADISGDDAEPLLGESAADVPESVPGAAELLPPAATWSGSVKSALGEVFALAGHGVPLALPSPMLRDPLADAAVDAALDDAGGREDVPPVVASLEQVLAAVRARRAALSGSPES